MHRLTEIDPESRTATCEECGPDAPIRFRRHRNHWACWTTEKRRSPEYWARHSAYTSANRTRQFPVKDMTQDDYDALLVKQDGVCAICGSPDPESSLAVDHCHATGRVRGLLCRRCNLALGLMRDDPERLLRAADYLTIA